MSIWDHESVQTHVHRPGKTKFHLIQNHECKAQNTKISHACEAPSSLEPLSTHERVSEASTAQAGPVPASSADANGAVPEGLHEVSGS